MSSVTIILNLHLVKKKVSYHKQIAHQYWSKSNGIGIYECRPPLERRPQRSPENHIPNSLVCSEVAPLEYLLSTARVKIKHDVLCSVPAKAQGI